MDSAPLGMFSAVLLQSREVSVSRGDRIFLYTDGFIEPSPGMGRREGLDRLVDSCVRHRMDPLNEVVSLVAADIAAGVANDDLLLLAVEVPQ